MWNKSTCIIDNIDSIKLKLNVNYLLTSQKEGNKRILSSNVKTHSRTTGNIFDQSFKPWETLETRQKSLGTS